jgi:error-prone DNA polymerase
MVYVSAWMKWRYPAAFACALLNSQPMGFYAPAQIVRDAREHAVEVRPVDVNHSCWDCTLEATPRPGRPALRLGFRQIKGMREDAAEILVAMRGRGYEGPEDVWRRAGLDAGTLERLANADAWRSCGIDRRQALWALKSLRQPQLPLFAAADDRARPSSAEAPREPEAALPEMGLGEHVVQDYLSTRLSLKDHPVRLLRPALHSLAAVRGLVENEQLADTRHGAMVSVAGLVVARQRPGTAKGVIFMTMEDETGIANIVVWPKVFETFRRIVLASRLLAVRGEVQREGIVVHVIAKDLINLTPLLDDLVHIPGESGLPQAPDGSEIPLSSARLAASRPFGNRHPRNIQPVREPKAPFSESAQQAMPKGRNFR